MVKVNRVYSFDLGYAVWIAELHYDGRMLKISEGTTCAEAVEGLSL